MKQDNPLFRRRALLATGLGALALAGCESLLPGQGPPPRLYRLTPKTTYPDLPRVAWQLVVEPPAAQASIDTPRIGLMLSPVRFDYYAQANWVDRAPLMVQSLIIESFDNSHAIVAVGRESIGLRPDYVLKSELREFQAESLDDRHIVNVALHFKLVQMPERVIVASAAFGKVVEAPLDQMGPVIEAFDEALGKVLKDVVVWTLTEGQKAEALRRKGLQRPDSTGASLSRPPLSRSTGTARPIQRLARP
ncbi:MAG: membrane integrity-associated transporter subunit PqiC [Alphaproteobacteria bacterium]|nr:membrane integrity-associated transporter subunit PqiC [Alphaproteobacteria bacterium]MCB9930171.1 membrane integrity-associated transporter subunit PqiC [Alphaproteobacteria bacterium]